MTEEKMMVLKLWDQMKMMEFQLYAMEYWLASGRVSEYAIRVQDYLDGEDDSLSVDDVVEFYNAANEVYREAIGV